MGYDSATAYVKDEQITDPTIYLLQVGVCVYMCICVACLWMLWVGVEDQIRCRDPNRSTPHSIAQMSNNPNPTHDAFKSITCTKAAGGAPQPPGKIKDRAEWVD